jgi:hypothetical protein
LPTPELNEEGWIGTEDTTLFIQSDAGLRTPVFSDPAPFLVENEL